MFVMLLNVISPLKALMEILAGLSVDREESFPDIEIWPIDAFSRVSVLLIKMVKLYKFSLNYLK